MMNSVPTTGAGPRRRPRQDAEDYVPRRKAPGARPVDTYASAIRHVKTRLHHACSPFLFHVPPHPYYSRELQPVFTTPHCPATAYCTQWVYTTTHPATRSQRARISFYALQWAPTGRRLLAITSRGEFLLINGHNFSVETNPVAHESGKPCRALSWGTRNDLILSGDDDGVVKMWLPSLVPLSEFNTNHRGVREMCWSPGEMKFVTCGQDGSAKVWDTEACATAAAQPSASSATMTDPAAAAGGVTVEEVAKLEGHGGDVATVDWHPFRALIATGSQDRDVRLWDPRAASAGSIASLQGHHDAVTSVKWHSSGQYLLSGGRDCMARLWDLRMVREITSYHGHSKDVLKVRWHPTHRDLLVTTGLDGSVLYWTMNANEGALRNDGARDVVQFGARIELAHDQFRETPNAVNDIAFSPTGHLLATCSYDVRMWHRNKPGSLEEKERGVDGEAIEAL